MFFKDSLGACLASIGEMCCVFLSVYVLCVQVVLEKFHSVLLTSCGVVLTCGHGRGGRLGHGSEASLVVRIISCDLAELP